MASKKPRPRRRERLRYGIEEAEAAAA